MQTGKDIHDLETCFPVKVAGRFITEENFRVIDQCPGNGDTLLLSTGELVRAMGTHLLVKSHGLKNGCRLAGCVAVFVFQDKRILHIFIRGKKGD